MARTLREKTQSIVFRFNLSLITRHIVHALRDFRSLKFRGRANNLHFFCLLSYILTRWNVGGTLFFAVIGIWLIMPVQF